MKQINKGVIITIDHIGEERCNNFGTSMKIIDYNSNDDITVEFQDEYHFIKKAIYANFIRGCVKNPYDKTLYGIGYIGHGKYKPSINKQNTPAYNQWVSMLERCYCEKRRYRTMSYVDCNVCSEWHNFQNFAEWFYENRYECGERLQVDKDILVSGNRTYSPQTCILVPQTLNTMFINRPNNRGLPNGMYKIKDGFSVKYNHENLGVYKTIAEAYSVYSQKKKQEIIKVANTYKNIISPKVYQAILNCEFKIENDVNYTKQKS